MSRKWHNDSLLNTGSERKSTELVLQQLSGSWGEYAEESALGGRSRKEREGERTKQKDKSLYYVAPPGLEH